MPVGSSDEKAIDSKPKGSSSSKGIILTYFIEYAHIFYGYKLILRILYVIITMIFYIFFERKLDHPPTEAKL